MLTYETTLAGLDASIHTLDQRLCRYKRLALFSQLLQLVLSTSIPILIALVGKDDRLLVLIAVFAALITFVQAFGAFYNLNEKIQRDTTDLMVLQKERLLFRSHSAPYDQTEASDVQTLIHAITTKTQSVLPDFIREAPQKKGTSLT